MKNLPLGVTCIKGGEKGPCVVIMGASHGDERLGKAVIARLKRAIKSKNLCGKLFLITGNPAAYAANKRFIDTDLNRLFGSNFGTLLQKPRAVLNCEEKRAVDIAPILQTADYLLDIHSTIKPSTPFVFAKSTKRHLKLASVFGTKYIVSIHPLFQPHDLISCADNYVDNKGGIGITYESGWHKKPTALPKVMEKIHKFLQVVGSLKSSKNRNLSDKNSCKTKHLFIYNHIFPKIGHFRFMRNFDNFCIVKKGEIIAEDGGRAVKAAKNSYIVFPKINLSVNSPACYLAAEK